MKYWLITWVYMVADGRGCLEPRWLTTVTKKHPGDLFLRELEAIRKDKSTLGYRAVHIASVVEISEEQYTKLREYIGSE